MIIKRSLSIASPESRTLLVLGALLALTSYGCAVASAPIKEAPHIAVTAPPGQVSVSMEPGDVIGDVQPVYVSIANGTDTPRSVVPSQVFALDSSGSRIAPLPAGEAARQAGGASELKAALYSGATSAAMGGAVGAGIGAITGALVHGYNGAVGAGIGAAVGGGQAAMHGVTAGQNKADQQAQQQLTALAPHPEEVRRAFTVSGYVFFPKGDYKQLQLLLADAESGDTEMINRPWK